MATCAAMNMMLLSVICLLSAVVMTYRLEWTTLDKSHPIVPDNVGKIEDMVLPVYIKGKFL